MYKISLFLMLVLVAHSTSPVDWQVDASIVSIDYDEQLLKVVNNYFGCKTWENEICTQCSAHYYFNKNGICCQVKPQCRVFNQAQGICESCYQGYMIVDGQCQVVDLVNSDQEGCNSWNNGRCTECSKRWYMSFGGVCKRVDDLCYSWSTDGQCQQCYKGYAVRGGSCIVDPNTFVPPVDSLCARWSGSTCQSCAERAYFDRSQNCVPVNDYCQTWNERTGKCLVCYKGYGLIGNSCQVLPDAQPTDIGCAVWDWNNQVCISCAPRWVMRNGQCAAVDDNCASWGSFGACTGCYKGYGLSNGRCVQLPDQGPSDEGCAEWNWDGQTCLKCSDRWVMRNGRCAAVDDNCATWNSFGSCSSCYSGYEVSNGRCVKLPDQGPSDDGCAEWNWNRQVCLQCSARWVMRNGRCAAVDDNCATWGSSGSCSSCYSGYQVSNGRCIKSPDQGPSDDGCAEWNWNRQICLQCSVRWVMRNGRCVAVDDNCAAWSSSGSCTGCYKGYEVSNGICVKLPDQGPSDAGCAEWNWDRQSCIRCSDRWYMRNGRCIKVDDNCATWSSSGSCSSCYKGYQVSAGRCIESPEQGPADEGCAEWNWDRKICLQCSSRWVMRNGRCVAIDDNCASWGSFGACTGCYKGYQLSNGVCVKQPEQGPSDAGCAEWNWDRQICLQCSARWVMRNGQCSPVDDNCATWGSSGSCSSCYSGYQVSNGRCIKSPDQGPSDDGCAEWNWNRQICLQCSARWVMRNGRCAAVDDNCAAWDSNGFCTGCYSGYQVSGGRCVRSPDQGPSDDGCAQWNWNRQTCLRCSHRWVMRNGRCAAVDDNCAAWSTSGSCTDCYKGYRVSNGACVRQVDQGPSDAGCAEWNWDRQSCLRCSDRWVMRNGQCSPVDDNCATWNRNGACTSCYKGYGINNGACVRQNEQGPSDAGCAQWNWDQQRCLQCAERWVMLNGSCAPVDDYCSTWNNNGACTSCYKGYRLENGSCSAANMLCRTYDSFGNCSGCYNGYVLHQNSCHPISQFASLALYYQECCPEKLAELRAQGRI